MPTLTYITTCKGRLAHLRRSLPRIVGQPGVECIVVDYGCPEQCGDWVEANFQSVRVIRAGPAEGFNASRARNLGASFARTPWIGFFDADILIEPSFSSRIVPELQLGNFYRSHPVTYQTWGSLICHRTDFERIGGYDEAYTGWGGEDDDLITFLLLHDVRQMGFPAELLDEVPHSDEQRTQFCEIKDRWRQSQINQVYLQAKLDLFRLLGTQVGRQDAVNLFAGIQRTLTNMADPLAEGTVQVSLPASLIQTPPLDEHVEIAELRRSLSLTLCVKERIPNPGIPHSKIDCIGMGPMANLSKEFSEDWFSHNIPQWAELLSGFRGRSRVRALEIGVFEGRSTCWLLENILNGEGSSVDCIDSFLGSREHSDKGIDMTAVRRHFESNIAPWRDRVKLYIGRSIELLPTLTDSYDIVYIDGSHLAADVLIDAVLAWRLTKDNGIIIFDDYNWPEHPDQPWLRPQMAVDAFLQCFVGRFRLLHSGYQLAIRKLSD